jgi:uncharacterized protein (TIGR03437 family)
MGVLWDGKPGPVFKDPETGTTILGNLASLEAQALLPFLNPVEMGHEGRTVAQVVARVSEVRPLALAQSIPPALARWIGQRSYAGLFEEAFGTADITPARIAQAISSYERTLIADRTPNERFLSNASLKRGRTVFGNINCAGCHALTGDSTGFLVTGVRPPAEDHGGGAVLANPQLDGSFRPPSLRGASLRNGLFHTGNASINEMIEFYNRGGDFKESPGFNSLLRPLNLTAQDKADLAALLRYGLVDQRTANEIGPTFDRPVLYSETARVPTITGSGRAAVNGTVPEIIAIEPPFAGHQRFTIALSGIAPGSQAVLVISETDPGATSVVPATGSLLRREVIVKDDAKGHGFTSTAIALPNTPGQTFFARWYVTTNGQVSVSRGARFTLFEAAAQTETFTTVSAASFLKGVVARGSIVTGKGQNLATAAQSAPAGFVASLGGVTITITDRTGAVTSGLISFVSPGQINYLIPNTVVEGEATARVLRGGVEVASGSLHIVGVAPGFFTANASGRDAPAAFFQRVDAGGGGTTANPIRFDNDLKLWLPTPVDLGPDTSQGFLILFGTGFRNREGAITATIGGFPAEVLFAGPQGTFEGLDQVNLEIPRSLVGRGEVEVVLQLDGQRTNPVIFQFQ